jgi:hypothetical protein
MQLEFIVAPLMVVWLLAMMYVGPSYFRRLRDLIERLAEQHAAEYERLGRPSIEIQPTRMASTASIERYVLEKRYTELEDAELTRLGNALRWRLQFMASGILFPLLMIIGALTPL